MVHGYVGILISLFIFIEIGSKYVVYFYSAVVQKYLLEKSRICSQGNNERNYHVFYYLLAGTTEIERQQLHLQNVESYNYLNKVNQLFSFAVQNIIFFLGEYHK